MLGDFLAGRRLTALERNTQYGHLTLAQVHAALAYYYRIPELLGLRPFQHLV